jgi:hypothetical protein
MEIYYLTMSKEICETIGAVNDENYLIAIKLLAAYHGVRGSPPAANLQALCAEFSSHLCCLPPP